MEIQSNLSIWDLGHAVGLLILFFLKSLSVIIIAIVTAIPLITNEIILKFLLAVSLVFVFCFSFQFIRGMFNAWLQLILSSIIYFMFLNLIIDNAIHFTDKLDLGPENSLVYGINMLISTLFIVKIIGILKELSSSLASVTADSIGSALGTKAGNFVNRQAGRGAAAADRGTVVGGKALGRGAVAGGQALNKGIEVASTAAGIAGQKYIVNPTIKLVQDYLKKN